MGEPGTLAGSIKIFPARSGSIRLGDRVSLVAKPKLNTLEARGPVILRTVRADSKIRIGDDTGMTSATISAVGQIMIGRRVLVGAGVLITDSDHHFVRPPRHQPRRFMGIPASASVSSAIHTKVLK